MALDGAIRFANTAALEVFGVDDLSELREGEARSAGHAVLDVLTVPIALGEGAVVSVGASIGVAHLPPGSAQRPVRAEDLPRSSDQAMCEAKRLGKGCVVVVPTGG